MGTYPIEQMLHVITGAKHKAMELLAGSAVVYWYMPLLFCFEI
jgi:hypothetical protein